MENIVLTISSLTAITIISVVWVICEHGCKHKWEEDDCEYTKDSWAQHYKVFTMKCSKCGKIKVKKCKIN